MKIAVCFTGGTIGSRATGPVLDVSDEAAPRLLELYYSARPGSGVELVPEAVFSVLSENMTLSRWKQLYGKVKPLSKQDCDGVIITHGTDTLAYTAAFFSFMLKPMDVPVLFVSANYPLEDERSNGPGNFIAAVDFIRTAGTRGVFVPFGLDGDTEIHLGARLLPARPFTHSLNSVGDVAYGRMAGGVLARSPHERNPTPEEVERPSPMPIPRFPEEKKILYLDTYPGMDYSVLKFEKKPAAILHGLYHSGTANTAPECDGNSIIAFAKRCIAQGIDFYAAPYDSRGMMYSTTKNMADAGIQFLRDVSPVAAYVKLLIAYGSFGNADERREFLESDVARERF